MRNFSVVAACLVVLTMLSSCDKYNQIDSSNTIKDPFVLHLGGLKGMVAKTNNAEVYDYLAADDGSFSKGMCTLDSFIFHFRQGVYVANGKKQNYAPFKQGSFSTINQVINGTIAGHCLNPFVVDEKRGDVYVCTNGGLAVCEKRGTQPFTSDPATGSMALATSIIALDNGSLFAFNCLGTPRFFRRDQPILPATALQGWQTLADPGDLSSANNEYWMLASQGNTIWAIEKNANIQPKFSTDFGATWSGTQDLPDSTIVTMAKTTALNKVLFVASDSVGLFRFNPGNFKFEFSSGGLPPYIRIFDIQSKRNYYRSDKTKDYYFLATNMGLYMSDDDAKNWTKVNNFAFSALN
jgi:hypothetical protein